MSAPKWHSQSHEDLIGNFVSAIQETYATGQATENSYRSTIESLFSRLGVKALNEPQRVDCGAPDFIILRGDIAIGHVEAKDLDVGIRSMKGSNKSQQERYKAALPNLIYTNALDWDFYRDGDLRASVTIADFFGGIIPKPEQYETLRNLLGDFVSKTPQTITSPRDLAERMAGKAKLVKHVLHKALTDKEAAETELADQYTAFKENLIHDITHEGFADVYAETIAYGMFAARLHDPTPDSFSRQEALELLPKSNPFLRSLFTYIAGQELDERIVWIIDDLASVFQACDVAKLMENFGKLTGQSDPFLHFYETFLAAYNPKRRKARGVWYTPEPVVNFIVRAVDQVLQSEFGLPEGLADTSRITIDWDTGQTDKKSKAITIKKDVHKVQILDPAVGTGTFLAEVVKQIKSKVQDIAPSLWSDYVERDLVPRLHGLELLMASYAMCHMKLDMVLTELNYKPTINPPRLRVFLSNSLEEGEPVNSALPFAKWISREAKGANEIKCDMPIMCVIGNPPYSGISDNKGKWISDLIEDYKYVDGIHFGEKKHWLQDDYVKFIRMSSHLIEKNGEGVLGFITNHGYLDNPTFRGMRWHLLNSFDRIFVLDLHGNTNKKEVTPDGRPDKNVFDIKQGVAIIIAVKAGGNDGGLAEVCHGDLWGTREAKYEALFASQIGDPIAAKIDCAAPQYPFVKRTDALVEQYAAGFGIDELMPINSTGIVSMGDGFALADDPEDLAAHINDLLSSDHTEASIKAKYGLGKNYPSWILGNKDALEYKNLSPVRISYRPFDEKFTYFDDRILWRSRRNVMRHMLDCKNIGLICPKIKKEQAGGLCTRSICGHKAYDAYDSNSLFPLYLCPIDEHDVDQVRRVNFDQALYKRVQDLATHPGEDGPKELAVFDYIYGVLHCLGYRKAYAEFLKIDFPRIPWPSSPDEFWDVSAKGTELRKLHLMEPEAIGLMPFKFIGEGDNMVGEPCYKDGKVWINKAQYFDNAPKASWELYIGGYQPAQQWLKDRKGKKLDLRNVRHYQRILKILAETDRIMGTINMKLTSGADGSRD